MTTHTDTAERAPSIEGPEALALARLLTSRERATGGRVLSSRVVARLPARAGLEILVLAACVATRHRDGGSETFSRVALAMCTPGFARLLFIRTKLVRAVSQALLEALDVANELTAPTCGPELAEQLTATARSSAESEDTWPA